MRRVEEAINIKLQPNSINRDSGIKIPEAWLPSIKKHNKKTIQQRTSERTAARWNNGRVNLVLKALKTYW